MTDTPITHRKGRIKQFDRFSNQTLRFVSVVLATIPSSLDNRR